MVIEDSPKIRWTLSFGLRKMGFDVFLAESVEDIVVKWNSARQPDIILLDVLLPKMDGFSFCKKLKNSKMGQNIPVIMMSGIFNKNFQIKEAKEKYGADDFLTKPFRMQQLKDAIDIQLGLINRKEITQKDLGIKTEGKISDIHTEKIFTIIAKSKKTCLIQLKKNKIVRRLYFNKGDLIFYSSNIKEDNIISILAKRNFFSEVQVEPLKLYVKEQMISPEKAIIDLRLVSEDEIKTILLDRAKKVIHHLLNWKNGEYKILMNVSPSDQCYTYNTDVRKLMMEEIINSVRIKEEE